MKKIFLLLGAAVAFSVTAFSAQAQDYKPYSSNAKWNVIYDRSACYAIAKDNSKASLSFKMGKRDNSVILNLGQNGSWIQKNHNYMVTFNLGQKYDFHGPAEGVIRKETGGHLLFTKVPNEYLVRLAKASNLNVRIDGAPKIPTISLRGSSEMLKTLHQCVTTRL